MSTRNPQYSQTINVIARCMQPWVMLGLCLLASTLWGQGTTGNGVFTHLDPNLAEERISMNFEEADIRTVVRTIGEITGINFMLDEQVRGKVTILSPTDIRLGDVYRALESVLQLHGFAAVASEDLVKIIPKAKAMHHNLPVRIGADPADIPLDDSLITQILPLTYARVETLAEIARALLSTDAKLSAYPRTNSLVITDTSARIHYVAKVLQELDIEGRGEKTRVFALVHASAKTLSEQIGRILEMDSGAAAPRNGRNATLVSTGSAGLRIMPDMRTNTLVAIALPHQMQSIADLVEQLDVPRRQDSSNVCVIALENAPAQEVAESLTGALADMRLTSNVDGGQAIQVTPDLGTNSLILSGAPHEFDTVKDIIKKLDVVREQVLVEMLIVEVTEESLTEIGVDWSTMDEAVASAVTGFGQTNLGPRVDFVNGDLEGLAVGAWRDTGSGVKIGAILSALQKTSGVDILSTPHITTQNHTPAKIIVGESRAFVTDSRVTENTNPSTPTVIKTYEYKDVGITLEITPHVSQGGLVRLQIFSELTKVLANATSPSVDTPTTAKRTAETVVTMQNGATMVIGGLIRDDIVKVTTKVPLLGDIPGLGALFRHTSDQKEKTNLLIFITPHVMVTAADMQRETAAKELTLEDTIDKARERLLQRQGKTP